MSFRRPLGTSLIETIIYIACFVLVIGVLSAGIGQLVRAHAYAQVTQETVASGRDAMNTLVQEIRHARSIYTPTSRLASSPGQLSLETTRDAATGEEITYVDFYVDNQQLYVKREGDDPTLITSPRSTVESFTLTSLNAGNAVRIALVLANETNLAGYTTQPSITLMATASLRPN